MIQPSESNRNSYETAITEARQRVQTDDLGAALYHLGRASALADTRASDGTDDESRDAWQRRRAWADSLARWLDARVSPEQVEIGRHEASGEVVRRLSTPRADRLELLVVEEDVVEWQDVSGQEYCLCGTGADFQSFAGGWRRQCPDCGLVLTEVITGE